MQEVSLLTIQKGLLVDMFNEELKKVMDNIADENYPTDATREITISVSIKPDKTRSVAVTKVASGCKLPKIKPSEGMCFICSGDNGKLVVCEDDYRQKELEDEDGNTIYQMPKSKEA